MNTQELINSVRNAYAGAAVYLDRGRVSVVVSREERPDTQSSGTFRTAFERSRGFEFEFRSPDVTPPAFDSNVEGPWSWTGRPSRAPRWSWRSPP